MANYNPRERNSLIGQTIGKLTVIERVPNPRADGPSPNAKWRVIYRCLCECGNETLADKVNLQRGNTTSCGCYKSEAALARHPHYNELYPLTYSSWQSMRSRCNSVGDGEYPRYGGRGIKIDPRWDTFINFLNDMGERPSKEYTLDRISPDSNYGPELCKWSSKKEQARNTRSNRLLEYEGETKTIAEWAEITGLEYSTLIGRINRGWDSTIALTTPLLFDEERRAHMAENRVPRETNQLAGEVFGKLTVIEEVPNPKTDSKNKHFDEIVTYKCKCHCGNEVIVNRSNLKRGNTTSCGCYRREQLSARSNHLPTEYPKEYNYYNRMKSSCNSPIHREYKDYGAKGIKVCDEWATFEQFIKDIGPVPSSIYELTRKDLEGNFEPSNCEWGVTLDDGTGKRGNGKIEYGGKIMTISQWSNAVGIPISTLEDRIAKKWFIKDVLTLGKGESPKSKRV